eukprot:g1746.t1
MNRRRGAWVRLRQLFVIRKGDNIAAPLPLMDYATGTQYFHYDGTRDALESVLVFYGALQTRFTPPQYTEATRNEPLGQRVESSPPLVRYREFPVPGYGIGIADMRVRDNNMWQSEVTKYFYQKMWSFPQDFTYLWPEAGFESRCSPEYLEKEVLQEMQDQDWAALVKRVKAPDANVITSEAPFGVAADRKAVLRIVRRATNCFSPISIQGSRNGFGFNYGVAITIFHILDELASSLVSQKAAFSQQFLRRARFLDGKTQNEKPLVLNAIPAVASVDALATELKTRYPAAYSYRFAESAHITSGIKLPSSSGRGAGAGTLLGFTPLEKSPLQFREYEKQLRNCLFFSDEDIMNLRLAAEVTLFPVKRDVYMDEVVLQQMESPQTLWSNAATLAQYKQALPATRRTPRGYAETVFTLGEQAILYNSRDMVIQGVADVLDMSADALESSIWRRELVYEDWGFRRLAGGRPQGIVYERERTTSYYPCSTIRKKDVEVVDEERWKHVDFETGVANHVANITATAPIKDTEILNMCQSVQQHCNGSNAQFANVTACHALFARLPTEDATCKSRRKEGSSSVQGDSLTCKWLQSRFLEFAPDNYCASMGASPPSRDRCSATLCTSNVDVTSYFAENTEVRHSNTTNPPAECDAEKKTEIVVGTLNALPFCLPMLVGNGQCLANCTQAINLFLGRHVESGAMQSCANSPLGIEETDGTGSLLLSLLQVNARTLIRRCVVSGSNGARVPNPADNGPVDTELLPHFLFSPSDAAGAMRTSDGMTISGNGISSQVGSDERGCDDPRLYMSETGCRELNWQKLAQAMLHEWDGSEVVVQQRPRRTRIQAVAWRESLLFDTWLQPYFNVAETQQVKAQLLKTRGRLRKSATTSVDDDVPGDHSYLNAHHQDLYLDGEISHGPHRYRGLDSVFSEIIERGPSTSGEIAQTFGLWRRPPLGIAFDTFTTQTKTAYTPVFNATKELIARLIAGVVDQDPKMLWRRVDGRGLHGADLLDEILKQTVEPLLSLPSDAEISVADRDAIIDFTKVNFGHVMPEHSHRSAEYLFGAAFVTGQQRLLSTLRRARAALFVQPVPDLRTDVNSELLAPLPSTHFARTSAQTDSMIVDQIVNANVAHQMGAGITFLTRTVFFPLVEFLRENWCELGAPWLSINYGHGASHFKGTDKAKILLEFLRIKAGVHSSTIPRLEKVPRPGSLLSGSEQNYTSTTMVVRYDQVAHHFSEDLFPDADKFDYTRENLDKVFNFGIFEQDLGEYNAHLFSERYSLPKDVELTDARLPQTKQQREVRLQRRCMGRNAALRVVFKATDRFLPANPADGGTCAPGNPNFVHDGVELLRQLIPITSGSKTYFLETFVHGQAAQKHSYGKNEVWTHFDYEKSDVAVDGSLFLFLNGNFPHPPQAWHKIVKYLHRERPDATSVLVNLPGYGKDTTRLVDLGGSDCGILGIASDILRDLIVGIKRSNTKTWPHIFLVGDSSPVGSGLVWATADKLNDYPSDYLSGLISLAPHPELALKPVLAMADAEQIPFYSLLSPIVGEMALGLNKFAKLRETLQDGKTYNADHLFDDGSPLLRDYTKFWKNTGIRSLTCYYRHNFHVSRRRMEATRDWFNDLHPAAPHVLLIRAERDVSFSGKQWMGAFAMIPRRNARHMKYHTVSDAKTEELLFKDKVAGQVAAEISRFALGVELTETWWLPSMFKLIYLPPMPSGGLQYDVKHDLPLTFIIVAAGLAVLGGLFMELKLGELLVKLESREVYWRFGQVAMVPLCLACMASQSWLGLPLFFAALFKFGFPEVTTLLRAPWMLYGVEHFVDRWARFVDGVGYLIHHTASSIIYAATLGHLVHPLMLTVAVPLALQHAVSPLKYGNEAVYGGVLLVLEVWYQCEFFQLLPHIRHWVPLLGLWMLVTAHWLWLANQVIVGIVSLFVDKEVGGDDLDGNAGVMYDEITGLPMPSDSGEGKGSQDGAASPIFCDLFLKTSMKELYSVLKKGSTTSMQGRERRSTQTKNKSIRFSTSELFDDQEFDEDGNRAADHEKNEFDGPPPESVISGGENSQDVRQNPVLITIDNAEDHITTAAEKNQKRF